MLRILGKIINKVNHKFEFIDLGGGMGISYDNNDKKLNYKRYNIAIKSGKCTTHKSNFSEFKPSFPTKKKPHFQGL